VIGLGIWQNLLSALGWVLSRLYDFIPSYAVCIIILTVFIRLLLLPLGIKQIRSMHAMTALQPKVKAIQTKYKGNRARQQEEIQKLYQEHGVNPLGGCLPMVLQIPVLIALYSVLRFPPTSAHIPKAHRRPIPRVTSRLEAACTTPSSARKGTSGGSCAVPGRPAPGRPRRPPTSWWARRAGKGA